MMKRIKCAYQSTNGKLFKKAKDAQKEDYRIESDRMAQMWFASYDNFLDKAVRNRAVFLEEFKKFCKKYDAVREKPKNH